MYIYPYISPILIPLFASIFLIPFFWQKTPAIGSLQSFTQVSNRKFDLKLTPEAFADIDDLDDVKETGHRVAIFLGPLKGRVGRNFSHLS